MLYVNRSSLEVGFAEKVPANALVIPTDQNDIRSRRDPIVRHTYFCGIYGPIVSAMERRSGIKAHYSMVEPDPWLIAVTAIMWEGILQGFAWDFVKTLVNAALAKLRGQGLAPDKPHPTRTKRAGAVEIGFRYSEYATDSKKQKELFLGYRRAYDRMTTIERLEPTRPDEWTEVREAELSREVSPTCLPAARSPRRRKGK
ncbi:MAG: hypothetical protein R2909_06890 [Gemmatimonadales bacterium]